MKFQFKFDSECPFFFLNDRYLSSRNVQYSCAAVLRVILNAFHMFVIYFFMKKLHLAQSYYVLQLYSNSIESLFDVRFSSNRWIIETQFFNSLVYIKEHDTLKFEIYSIANEYLHRSSLFLKNFEHPFLLSEKHKYGNHNSQIKYLLTFVLGKIILPPETLTCLERSSESEHMYAVRDLLKRTVQNKEYTETNVTLATWKWRPLIMYATNKAKLATLFP